MKIKIDLSRQDVDCLRKHLPPRSSALAVLEKAAHLENYSGVSMADEWFTFSVQQARDYSRQQKVVVRTRCSQLKKQCEGAASGSLRPSALY
jgi:hypothetical protein